MSGKWKYDTLACLTQAYSNARDDLARAGVRPGEWASVNPHLVGSPYLTGAGSLDVAFEDAGLSAQQLRELFGGTMYAGSRPLVVCNGAVVEAKDLDDAQQKAEQLAHQHQSDAYILKPVTKVAPKRDVVVTALP